MTEIRPAEEPLHQSGPVRSLMENGTWLVPESERPKLRPIAPEPVKIPKPVIIAARPQPPAKPKPNPVKREYRPDPNFAHVTVAAIIERQAAGKTLMEIAAEFGCSFALIAKRLKATHETKEYQEMRTCPGCGGRKWPSRESCGDCARRAK